MKYTFATGGHAYRHVQQAQNTDF